MMDVIDQVIEQRAESFAYLYLTANKRLAVYRQYRERNPMLDFLVKIKDRTFAASGEFGVEVEGVLANGRDTAQTEVEMPDIQPKRLHADSAIPVCLFVFFVDMDCGYYRWLREPVLDGTFQLKNNDSALFRSLNDTAVNAIVAQVQQWHKSSKRATA